MKIKAIAAAVIAAGLTQSALALPIGATINLHMYASGATAQDKALQNMAIKLCDTGTVDIYTDTNGKPEGASYSAFSCTMSPAKVPGLSGTLNIMMHKRSSGGSAWGVGPVAAGQDVPQMQISAANCPTAATPATATINGTVVNVWKCSNATLMSPAPVVDIGISDVEPALFSHSSNLIPVRADLGTVEGDPGTFPIPQAQLDAMTIVGMSSVTFGIPVTLNLRNALQVAQYGAASACVGSDDVNCMPSLTKTQVNSLFAGTIGTWSKFKVLDPADGVVKGLNAVTGVTPPSGQKVNICRRVNGSGTQTQFNALFLGDGCSKGALVAKSDNSNSSTIFAGTGVTSQGVGSSVLVHENSGSGDVDACLNNLQTANIWAAGIQSLEKGSNNYRFVAIDGVQPTLKNVATNKYWDWAANSMQWRSTQVAGTPPVTMLGDKLTIANALVSDISAPADLAILNANFNPRITGTDSQVGYLALNTNPLTGTKFATSIPFAASNPVMTATRNGAQGNNAPSTCSTAVILNAVDSQMIK